MNGHSLSFPAAGSIPGQERHSAGFDGVVPVARRSTKPKAKAQPPVQLAPVASPSVAVQPAVAVAQPTALDQSSYEAAKRVMDILLSAAAMVALSPFFLVFALWIKLQDGGPVFFIQKRVGKNGRLFNFYKFRSMIQDADRLKDQLAALNEHGDHRTFKMKHDPRVTRAGRIMRRLSLDELPQLLNILKGDMAVVGPRPALPNEVALYTQQDRRRLEVTPGLTCLWQVRGRAMLPFNEQVRLDVEYIENRSLLLDLEIIAQTIPAVLTGRGAY